MEGAGGCSFVYLSSWHSPVMGTYGTRWGPDSGRWGHRSAELESRIRRDDSAAGRLGVLSESIADAGRPVSGPGQASYPCSGRLGRHFLFRIRVRHLSAGHLAPGSEARFRDEEQIGHSDDDYSQRAHFICRRARTWRQRDARHRRFTVSFADFALCG